MYEYGCFVSFWGNFEMVIEALICHFNKTKPVTNCREVNKLPTGKKHNRLKKILRCKSPAAVTALNRVVDVAERNDWVHGVVLNPRGDFSKLTRFRAHHKESPFRVDNTPIDLSDSPFKEFYEAYEQFEQTLNSALGRDIKAMVDEYLIAVQDSLKTT